MPKKTEINVSKKDLVYILNGLDRLIDVEFFRRYENKYKFNYNHANRLNDKLTEIFDSV